MTDIATTNDQVQKVILTSDTPLTVSDLKKFAKAAADFPNDTPVTFSVKGQDYQPDKLVATYETPIVEPDPQS